ncbi:MAG TPA: hypothetical protein VLH81_12875, partial [Desulfobacterales bacterium]|nr:hypothetical protein [Desulfobacterales bacterium]
MKLRDVTWLSARGLMARPLEAVLEVSAIAIGVALFSTSLSLIRYYANDIEAAAQDIRFRTARIAVYTRSEPASLDTALPFDVPVDKLNQPIPLSLLSTIRSECPIIRWAYADEEWGFLSGSLEIMTALSVRKVSADFFEAHRL